MTPSPAAARGVLCALSWTIASCSPPAGPAALGAEVDEASGLDERPANPTCHPPPAPPGGIQWFDPFPLLPRFAAPTALRRIPGDAGSWFVAERAGRIFQFDDRSDVDRAAPVLDLSDRVSVVENGGLLGLAFHPRFRDRADRRFVYVFYTAPGGAATSRLSRFWWPDGSPVIDRDSEQILIAVTHDDVIHMSDDLRFGPDGMLYASIGDGGPQTDPYNRSQNPYDLRGKMWRIDVDGGDPYAIPDGNPFKDGGGAPEVYALGLRNPFRFSFDRETGALYAGDVGYGVWEEIDRIEAGGNYGWNCFEGAERTGWPGTDGCPETVIPPLHTYNHDGGSASVTGGVVYRGSEIPALAGKYLFADFITTSVRMLDLATGEATDLGASGANISDFSEDADGEVIVTDLGSGSFRRLTRGTGEEPPPLLSQTGCFDPADPAQPVPALIPFDVRSPLWSDGATKRRWLALPDGATIHVDSEGDRAEDFSFPPGAVLVKEFAIDGVRVETRFFVRHDDGEWSGYTYQWRPDQSDAVLIPNLPGQLSVAWGDRTWDYPGRGQCFSCHSSAAGRALGPEIGQLNSTIVYPATGRTANQLATLAAIGLFDEPIGLPSWNLSALPAIDGPQPAEQRARSLLHANCAPCHRPGGPGRGPADFRYSVPLAETGVCDAAPTIDTLGIDDARLIAPGSPERSIVLERMSRRGAGQMPPLATRAVDDAGAAVMREWIAGMDGCVSAATSLSVVNAASFRAPVAYESVALASGDGLATASATAPGSADAIGLPTRLGGTTVIVRAVDGAPVKAHLLSVTPWQVNFVMPALEPGVDLVDVTITAADGEAARQRVAVASVAPGLYSANYDGAGPAIGQAAHIGGDGALSLEPLATFDPESGRYVASPITRWPDDADVLLVLYGTGVRGLASLEEVTATIDGVPAEVVYAGAQGGFAGLDQINLRAPATVFGRGLVDVIVRIGGAEANRLHVLLR